MKSAWLVSALCLTVSMAHSVVGADERQKSGREERAKIQLAILLDTSGSMDGLINQARTQLWKIVNQLATAKRDGQVPDLEVALYEYGKNSIPKQDGFTRQIVGLTDDLDQISEELFKLRTNGGKEYCGHVIQAATRELKWSEHDQSLKLIFICGNEPFTQGSVDYKQACSAAIAKGVTVSTIFCGPEQTGRSTGWQHGAQLADGSFLSINQDRVVAAIQTPFDRELSTLSSQVSQTYAFAGKEAKTAKKRQTNADRQAAAAAPAAAAERAQFKVSGQYRSAGDLVDGLANGKVKLETIAEADLPPALQKKSVAEKRKILEQMGRKRKEIHKQIRDLSAKRANFISKERAKQAATAKQDSLDTAIIKALRSQAHRKLYVLPE